ncbi:hypothetical protein MASR1M66_02130 [Aminivibrio sp.]
MGFASEEGSGLKSISSGGEATTGGSGGGGAFTVGGFFTLGGSFGAEQQFHHDDLPAGSGGATGHRGLGCAKENICSV